jgi:hypothetical protein
VSNAAEMARVVHRKELFNHLPQAGTPSPCWKPFQFPPHARKPFEGPLLLLRNLLLRQRLQRQMLKHTTGCHAWNFGYLRAHFLQVSALVYLSLLIRFANSRMFGNGSS